MFEINIKKALKNGTLREKIDNMKREIERMDNEIKRYEKALEESKKPKLAIPFIPKDCDVFSFYYDVGETQTLTFKESDESLKTLTKILRCFRTPEEAKLSFEKFCAETELLMMCDGLEKELCFVPYFDDKNWCIDRYSWHKSCPYRFYSKKSCQAAIEKLGDRKLRLIFNIPLEK